MAAVGKHFGKVGIHAPGYASVLGGTERGQLAVASARLHFYVAQLGEHFLAPGGELAVALGNLENLNRGAVHGLADVPARAVASVVLYVKRLVAFWRGSEFRRGRRGVGVSVVIACELVKLKCGRGG